MFSFAIDFDGVLADANTSTINALHPESSLKQEDITSFHLRNYKDQHPKCVKKVLFQ